MSTCFNNLSTNFSLEVIGSYNLIDSNSSKVAMCDLALRFSDGSTRSVTLPVSGISKINWLELDPRCRFDPSVPRTKVQRILEDHIRECLQDCQAKTVYRLNKVGIYNIEGEHVFCTGREVIRPSARAESKPAILLAPMEQSLDYDPNISERKAIQAMMNLICRCINPGQIVFSQKIVYFLRQAYVDAGKAPCVCVFLYGTTGMMKTAYSSFLTQTYNRSSGIKGPLRLNASIAAAVNILQNTRDDVVIFDDLCPADSKQIRGQQEETLIEITRYIGDGTMPAKMCGNNVRCGSPECGVLFTGEYLIGSGSDAARLIPVEMEPINGAILKEYQDNPLVISTFYRYFIKWAVDNYDSIVTSLKKWLEQYRHMNMGVHPRLQESHFFLNSANMIFTKYLAAKNVFNKDQCKEINRAFSMQVKKIVQTQNRRVGQKVPTASSADNYLAVIAEQYRNGDICYANTVFSYTDGVHDGVIHDNCLCLRGTWFAKIFPGVEYSVIADSLERQGALIRGNGKEPAKQISKAGGKRFYFIPLNRLNNAAQ